MNDAAAIKKCQDGESEAFRHLVERYQRQAVGHASMVLRNHEDALDAAQEAFVDAFKNLSGFDPERPFYPWFYVLLRNRCYKLIGRKPRTENIDEIAILAAPEGITPEERLALERDLLSLPDDQREIVTLKYFDGLSYDELATRLEIPKGTVMSRLFHARKNLQKELSGIRG